MVFKQKISFVLSQAYPTLNHLEDDYFLIGSSALILSGVDLTSETDIDILTSSKNAEILKVKWGTKLRENYQPADSSLFRSNFARFDFGSMDIEVMGGLLVKKGDSWNPVIIKDYLLLEDNGLSIKIPTLEEQKRILEFFGRDKDKEKLNLINSSQRSIIK